MFTEQVGLLDTLEGKWPSIAIDTLRSLLGNCSQELVHRGPVTFDGPVEFPGGVTFLQNTIAGFSIAYAKAVATWTNGTMPYVLCHKMSGRTGSTSSDEITVYLPKTKARDPNVQIDDVIAYMELSDTEGMAVTGYLDDKLGTIKGWDDPADIPPGWELVAEGCALFGYASGDPDFGTVGGTGGSLEHTHADHTSGINAHAAGVTGLAGAETIPFTGSISNYTETASLSPGNGAISWDGTGSGYLTTDAKQPWDFSGDSGNFDSELVGCHDPMHSHGMAGTSYICKIGPGTYSNTGTAQSYTDITFNGSSLVGPISGIQITYFRVPWDRAEIFDGVSLTGDHDHLVNIDTIADNLEMGTTNHVVTMSSHGHTASVSSADLADHQHSMPAYSHSFTLEHSVASNLPPYTTECWIKRVA